MKWVAKHPDVRPGTDKMAETQQRHSSRQRVARREAQEMLTELRERYLLQPLLQPPIVKESGR